MNFQRPDFDEAPEQPRRRDAPPRDAQDASDSTLPHNESRVGSSPTLPYRSTRGAAPVAPGQAVHFDEAQLAAANAHAVRMGFTLKDDLAVAAGKVTPGVDDTPYIQYALEALTREHGTTSAQQYPLRTPEAHQSYASHVPRRIPDEDVAFMGPAYDARRSSHVDEHYHLDPTPPTRAPILTPVEPALPPPPTFISQPTSEQWIAVDKNTLQTIDPRGRTYPPLTYKPRILRPFSIITFMMLCLLMIAALIFCDRFSAQHAGLTTYSGSIYSGQYFVFRILPQLLAAVILIYAQSIVTASVRILPFTVMAQEDPRERYLALFQSLYPTSFLRPQLVGPWQVMVFDLATWFAIFTLPLQSSLFACRWVGEAWVWAPSQGVVWTLVALYAFLIVSANMTMAFWFGQWTGLRWDIRCIADLIPLANRTNTMSSYRRGAVLGPGGDFKARLRDRWFDRLGYWQTEDVLGGGIWHAIGTSAILPDQGTEVHNDTKRESYGVSIGALDVGARHLPWCLRDAPLIAFTITAWGLLLALLIVSFLPATRLEDGFAPRLTAMPTDTAFSPANFVYSFVPSLLGMVLFLLFQSVDQALRIVQPWGDLGKADGAIARRSILADYAACLPLQATWRALANGHWRVAVTSLMSVLFVFIPVLAGGLFMALTDVDQKVGMFPSMPVFGVLLAFLSLYAGCLALLVPHRRHFSLPHPVTSTAEVLSLCSADELVHDAAFRAVRSHRDLVVRLGVGRDDTGEESTWFLGLAPGRDEQGLSVRRLKRFDEEGTGLAREVA